MAEDFSDQYDILSGLITVHVDLALERGPGQRFSVEPFAEGTWRVMDYLSRKCVAMCPDNRWAVEIMERLNQTQVFIRDDITKVKVD